MRKNIFKYAGEEKEISLPNVNDLNSNNSSVGSQDKKRSIKVKFRDMDTLSPQKTYREKNQKIDDETENNTRKFERRKKKFNTLFLKQSQIFEFGNKKKKRKKGKHKTVMLSKKSFKKEDFKEKKKSNKSIHEEEVDNDNDNDNDDDDDDGIIDEFEDKEMQTKLEVVLDKKFVPTQTMLSYCKIQLFISYENMTGFQYTGLEGILCVVINRLLSNLYLQIYDIMDFKKQFEIELYTNIILNKGYEVVTKKFHTIEFPTFCLGLNFYTNKKANQIKNIILNYSKVLNSCLFYQYEKNDHDTFKQKKLFDYISDPKKISSYNNDKKKKAPKEVANQVENTNNNNNNENDSNYLENIFTLNRKLNFKISSNEMLLSFSIDKEANEVTFDTSKGANRFLEQNNIEISEINEEYEKMKEMIKSKVKNNKAITNKTKKSIQEEIKDKENKEKIMEILNHIEGLQTKDKNILNLEDDKEKMNNKIKKFNVTKRLPINQKTKIESSPDNFFFYGENSSFESGEENEEEEDDEEGEEEEDEAIEHHINEEEDNVIKNILNNNPNANNNSNNKFNIFNFNNSNYKSNNKSNYKSNIKSNNISNKNSNNILNLNTGNNLSPENSEQNKSIQLSGIPKKMTNSSEISSNNLDENKNKNNNKKTFEIYSNKKGSSSMGSKENKSSKNNNSSVNKSSKNENQK